MESDSQAPEIERLRSRISILAKDTVTRDAGRLDIRVYWTDRIHCKTNASRIEN